ncbi:hypothetical protein ACFL26_00130 [Patescibacteria group bacterium]
MPEESRIGRKEFDLKPGDVVRLKADKTLPTGTYLVSKVHYSTDGLDRPDRNVVVAKLLPLDDGFAILADAKPMTACFNRTYVYGRNRFTPDYGPTRIVARMRQVWELVDLE